MSEGIGTRRLTWAVAVAVLAALLQILGPLFPLVRPDHPAGFAAGPLFVVLALLPPVGALFATWRRRPAAGLGLLMAVALFAPGRLVSDLQLATDVSYSARPELVLPTSLAPLHPGVGLWLLVAGHACAMLAGGVAAWSLRAARGDDAGTAAGGAPRRQGRVTFALSAGLVAAVALLVVAPLASDDPFLLSRTLLEQQAPTLVGGLLLMIAAVVASVSGAAYPDRWRAVGGTAGAALGLLTVAVPDVVSGLAVPRLHPTWGPCVVLAVAAALAVLASFIARAGHSGVDAAALDEDRELELPPTRRLHAAAGTLGVLGGSSALVAAFVAQLAVPPTLPVVTGVERWLLVPAGALVAVLGLAMVLPRSAAPARPAFAVASAAVPMAAAAALDFVLTATRIDGVHAAAGPWLAGLAVLLVLAAACCAGLAGGVERDEVDLSHRRSRPAVLCAALLGLALAVAGFGIPVERASGYTPPGLWSNFRFASWGMVIALLALLVVALLAAFSRRSRAVALLLGGAAVLGVHCAALPLTASRGPDTTAGAGELLSVLGVVALLVAAGLAALPESRTKLSGNG